jgi:hypothetical protein
MSLFTKMYESEIPKFDDTEFQYIIAALSSIKQLTIVTNQPIDFDPVGITDISGKRWLLSTNKQTVIISRGSDKYNITKQNMKDFMG